MFSLLCARHSNKFIAWVSSIVKRPLKKRLLLSPEAERERKRVDQGIPGSQWQSKDENPESLSLDLIPLTISDAIHELETDREL